jgi:tellurite methyltransferase
MTHSSEATGIDLADTAVRAVVLHSLLEFQGGKAKTIRVTKHGSKFSVADDGRGHPLDKELEGISYLRFIYTHFEYPFGSARGAPVQLQGIGISLVNALCSELLLTVRKQHETLSASFQNGRLQGANRTPGASQETGIAVQGKLRPELSSGVSDSGELEEWLRGIVQVHPTLRLFFNGRELRHAGEGTSAMNTNASIRFFDEQFQRQVAAGELQLNPFELAALPHVRGDVLDYGCGLGNLSLAAARQGCSVLALDGSHAAIEHLRALAQREGLRLRAHEADLRTHELGEAFDTVVCIGLLMFFDCPTALRQLADLQAHVRPGGTLVVNVLTEGTTFMNMFSPEGHCLFARSDLARRFAGWDLLAHVRQEFAAPRETLKVFETVIARKAA